MELFSVFGRILLKDDGIENKLKGITGQAENTGSRFGSVFKGLGSTLLKVGGIIGAGLGFKAMFSAAEGAEGKLAQMDSVLKSTGGAAGMSKQALLQLADAQGKLTTFSKGANIETENLLLTFTNIGKKTFPDALKSVNDMSQALGQDTKSSAIQLGKALNDPIKGITALSRVGVSFTSQQKEQIKSMVQAGDVAGAQSVILKELQKEFGGSAEAAGKTFGGQLQILRNQILGVGASALSSLLPVLSNLISKINSNMPQIQKVVTTVFKTFGDSVKFVADNINWLIPVIAGLAGGFVALKVIGIVNGLIAAYTAFTTTATGVQIGLNAALAANPIGLIITAIAALIAIGVALVMNWDKVKAAAGTLLGGIKDVFGKVGNFVSNTWNTMKQNTAKAWEGIKSKVEENGGGIQGVIKTGAQIYVGLWKKGFETINNLTGGKLGEALNTVKNKVEDIKNNISNKWNEIKENTSKSWQGIKNKVQENGGGIQGIIKTGAQIYVGLWKKGFETMDKLTGGKLGSILKSVKDVFKKIGDVFTGWKDKLLDIWNKIWNFKVPKIKLPHFSISGSLNPIDWVKNGVPTLGVKWYDQGGIFNRPSIIGVGERRPEFVGALQDLESIVKNAVHQENRGNPATIIVPVSLDGEVIAKVIAPYSDRINGKNVVLAGRSVGQ